MGHIPNGQSFTTGCSRNYMNIRKEDTEGGVKAIAGCCHSNRVKGDAEDVKWARIHSSLSRDLAECTNKLTDKATVKLNEGHNEMVAWHNNDTTDCRLGTRDGHKI